MDTNLKMFFKYRARLIATKRCRLIKASRNQLETGLLQNLNGLTKENNTEEEKLEIKKISLQLDELYLDLARGAFVRSRAMAGRGGEKLHLFFCLGEEEWSKENAEFS